MSYYQGVISESKDIIHLLDGRDRYVLSFALYCFCQYIGHSFQSIVLHTIKGVAAQSTSLWDSNVHKNRLDFIRIISFNYTKFVLVVEKSNHVSSFLSNIGVLYPFIDFLIKELMCNIIIRSFNIETCNKDSFIRDFQFID